MRVTRIITKDVEYCQECPYYCADNDMGATIHLCGKIEDVGERYLSDIHNGKFIISSKCPLVKEEK